MLKPLAPDEKTQILGSAAEICQVFQIGQNRLTWWRQQPGFPVRIICGRLTGHRGEIEEFMKKVISNSAE